MKEGWENVWYLGFFGSLILAGVAYVFKPDTSYVVFVIREKSGKEKLRTDILNRIQTWALEEARRRLEMEGILEDPEKTQKN